MRDGTAYTGFVAAVLGKPEKIRELSAADMDIIDELLESLPAAKLSGRSTAEILRAHYGLNCSKLTLEQIAKIHDVSPSAISAQEHKALGRLRLPSFGRRILERFYRSKAVLARQNADKFASDVRRVMSANITNLRISRKSARAAKLLKIKKISDFFQILPADFFIAQQKDRDGVNHLRIEMRRKYGILLAEEVPDPIRDE